MKSPPEPCFHCGLPVPPQSQASLEVFGRERPFCCPGCYAVSRAIVAAGLDDYYRHREAYAERAGREAVPEVLRKLDLYDRPDIQKGFVRASGPWREAHLILENIRCAACLWLNERRLRQLEGVLDVAIDYATQRARVRWDPQRLRLSEILEAIAALGYLAHPYDPAHREALLKDEKRRSGGRLLFAGLAGMPVMQFALATYVMGDTEAAGQLPLWVVIGRWSNLFVVLAILFYAGQDFFVGAWRDLKNRRLGMDVPVVLGISTALIGSIVATGLQRGEVYYDSIVMFVFFLLIARHVEMRGRRKAAAALDRLAKVVPATARRLGAQGAETEVAVVDLEPGDRVRIRPGEIAPLDGVLVAGASAFDESLLTGESVPVQRREGDTVSGGSCNREQPVVMQVTRARADSAPNRVRRLLDQGLRGRPRYAVLAERAASGFVGGVVLLAGITAAVWLWWDPGVALANTVAVLIVTCPCALALATPVALALSAGRFAELGVLPVRMEAVERFAEGDLLVLDKTGTLTEGRPRLASVQTAGELDRDQAVAYGAALEQSSEHPIAHAFRDAAPGVAPLTVSGRQAVPGKGVAGMIDAVPWRLGSPEFVLDGRPAEAGLGEWIEGFRAAGLWVQALGNASGMGAVFALEDALRPGAQELVAELRSQGLGRIALLSGDHAEAVRPLAATLGIEEARGAMSPADKLNWIQNRQGEGWRIIMVGDGLNDAPTLAAADVSLSFQDATDLAQIHSDFILLGQDLQVLAQARCLAIRTRRTIRQNVFWAVAYNLLAVPAAALGLIPPWAAAIGMSVSSLIVVGNAWRL